MDRDELIALLQKLPEGTEVFVRAGAYKDSAYTPVLKIFEYQKQKVSAYIDVHPHSSHYNYPEGYSGVVDVTSKYA